MASRTPRSASMSIACAASWRIIYAGCRRGARKCGWSFPGAAIASSSKPSGAAPDGDRRPRRHCARAEPAPTHGPRLTAVARPCWSSSLLRPGGWRGAPIRSMHRSARHGPARCGRRSPPTAAASSSSSATITSSASAPPTARSPGLIREFNVNSATDLDRHNIAGDPDGSLRYVDLGLELPAARRWQCAARRRTAAPPQRGGVCSRPSSSPPLRCRPRW